VLAVSVLKSGWHGVAIVSEFDSYELFALYQAGGSEAAAAIFERYVARLVALARRRMSAKMQRRLDPDDVVQSAYRSFFLHAANDEFVISRSGDLWRLLARITLNKLHGQVEKHTAARRSINQEEAFSHLLADATVAPEPTPAEVIALMEQLHLVADRLSEAERSVLAARLQGQNIDEIAKSLGRSSRTVRRLLAKIKDQIEQQLAVSGSPASDDEEFWDSPMIDRCAGLNYSDYVITQILGAGGMGKVYRARERSTGKGVAVKALRKLHQRHRGAIEQFVQEAQILATLNHPNIVRVHGLGRFPGGGLFMVMDLVEGTNLQDRLHHGPLEVKQALSIMCNITEAIAYAHDHGIVHCDLKPGNVLLDPENRPFVSDFGFAHILASRTTPRLSAIGGTAGYMAPEVYRLGQTPSVAADVFGLGALLWALVSGKAPEEPVVDGSDRSDVAPIACICSKCLVEAPRERYRSVRELKAALAQVRL
jgi:eukaryotic-like serine/threonine-protein kinase